MTMQVVTTQLSILRHLATFFSHKIQVHKNVAALQLQHIPKFKGGPYGALR